jgi:hypothetical protein
MHISYYIPYLPRFGELPPCLCCLKQKAERAERERKTANEEEKVKEQRRVKLREGRFKEAGGEEEEERERKARAEVERL